MKILITGANGYIGKTLANHLGGKYELTLLTRQTVDICNSYQLKDFFVNKHFDVVIHCAITGGGRLDKDDSSVLDTNLKMFYNLVENDSHFDKFIHFGSGAENDNTFYGLSKRVINQSIINKEKFHNIRIFNVFNERELDYKFIKSNIRKYLNHQGIEIFQNKYMDFFYMSDFITLIEFCMNNNIPKTVDCSYEYRVTLYDVAQIINKLDKHKVDISISNWTLASDFCGTFTDFGLKYVGLEQGIVNVYNHIKNEH